MTKNIITNMFEKQEPLKRFCTVVKPMADGTYQVVDSIGRNFTVDATTAWQVGEAVVITNSRIVGRAAKFKTPIVHEV